VPSLHETKCERRDTYSSGSSIIPYTLYLKRGCDAQRSLKQMRDESVFVDGIQETWYA